MHYFEEFKKISYLNNLVTDITTRISVVQSVANAVGATFPYLLQHDELPEDVAFNVYGDSSLHWLILETNEVTDPFYGWYMRETDVDEYARNKYDDINAIHHYLYEDAIYKDLPDVNATYVTNREHENNLNSDRQKIKVIYPKYLTQILTEFRNKVNG